MHEMTLLINIAVALVAAFFGGLAARRVGLPTIVSYMLAGISIGPFTPGFVGDVSTISQLAELGVIFLTFATFGQAFAVYFRIGNSTVLHPEFPNELASVCARPPFPCGICASV